MNPFDPNPADVTGTLKQAGEGFVQKNLEGMREVRDAGRGMVNWLQRGAQSMGRHGQNIRQLFTPTNYGPPTGPTQYTQGQLNEMNRMRNMDQGNLGNRLAREQAYQHYVMNKPALPPLPEIQE